MPRTVPCGARTSKRRAATVTAAPRDDCPLPARCPEMLLACRAFGAYVLGGSPRRWRAMRRVPTPERYAALDSAMRGRPPKAEVRAGCGRLSG
jgi:hypothetical protein